MSKILSIFLLLVLPLNLFSQYQKAYPKFTYQDLKKLIKEKGINSVEALTAELPEELQNNVTISLKPRNRLQEGPRAIRFTSDGRLTLTHNDDSKKKGGNNVELIEVDDQGNQIMHDIQFDSEGKTPPVFSEGTKGNHENMGNCTACHGDPPRKIFQSYNQWKGMCGENDDKADAECLATLKALKSNPRFKDMKWDEQNPAWPFMLSGATKRHLGLMPNTRFSFITMVDNAKQNSLIVQSSPLYPKLKYSLIYQYMCNRDPQLYVRFIKNIAEHPSTIVPHDWKGTRIEYVTNGVQTSISKDPLDTASNFNVVGLFSRANYFEFFGVQDGITGGNEVSQRNGSTRIPIDFSLSNLHSQDYLVSRLIGDLEKEDPKLQELLKDQKLTKGALLGNANNVYATNSNFYAVDDKFLDHIGSASFYSRQGLTKTCDYLKEKTMAEMDRFEADPGNRCEKLEPRSNSADVTALGNHMNELALQKGKELLTSQKCIQCHDGKSGKNVGPKFSFSDSKTFALENERYMFENGIDLVKATEMTLQKPDATKRMPLNRPAMTMEEQKALLYYLKFMAY